jgi:acyl carrier protein
MGLDAVELIMEIEKTFGITFPERAPSPVIATVGDLYQFILGRLAESTPETLLCQGTLTSDLGDWTPREVWEILRVLIAEQLGVPLERVTESAHLAKDLGMN